MIIKSSESFLLESEERMFEFASDFSKKLKGGNIIFLNGPLGVGKTTFVKGIAKGLNIKKIVTSPTFQIIKEYDNKLCHIDAYRIYKEDLGIDFYKDNQYIICIEWSENLDDIIHPDYVLNIEYDLNGRKVQIDSYE